MTPETQTLVDRLRARIHRHHEPGSCKIFSLGDQCPCGLCDMDRLAAAFSTLSRDLAAARQERDAALLALSVARDVAHEYQQQGEKLEGEVDAAVRAARAETETAVKERDEARALHQELMFQVGSKWPGETRHETAKRYIREREDLGRLPPFGAASAAREGQ